MRSIVALVFALFGSIINAMPTLQEVAAAEPLVKVVMKAETEALTMSKIIACCQ